MSECGTNSEGDDHGGALAMTSAPLARQHLFARIAGSARHGLLSRIADMPGYAELPGRAEFARLRPATRVLIVGLAAWIGLVGLATAVAVGSVETSRLSLPAWLGARPPASANAEMNSPARFENILRRPLFSRSRQGVAEVVPTPTFQPATMLDPNITLKGVFMSGVLAKAFLTSAQVPLGVWVQANDEIAGWRVVAVTPDRVLLDGRNEKLVIQLNINGTAK
jgi:hypothetical protein